MARRVKKERIIHCTTCGKTYADPIAAQNHARKHPEIQQATASLTVSTVDTGAVHPLPPPRRAHPNLSGDVSESSRAITPEVPQVAAPPVAMMKSETVSNGPGKLFCRWCPHLEIFTSEENLRRHTRRHHPNVYKCTRCQVEMPEKDDMWKHMVDLHGAKHRERVLKKLRKGPANATVGRRQSIPNANSTDELQPLSEGEESQSSDDERDEQQPILEEGWEPLAQDHQQSFACDLCPESFLTMKTFVMHVNYVHSWKCGYCRGIPPFSSISLWREHRATVHGLAR